MDQFTCGHGTTTAKTEFNEALDWAANKYPDKVLTDVGFPCWIIAFRRWVEANEKKK